MSDIKQKTAAFAGAIIQAECDCHKGKFIVLAIAISCDGTTPDFVIGEKYFDTLTEAQDNQSSYVSKCAREFLQSLGVAKKDILTENSFLDDEVKIAERKYRNNNNINLN